MKALGLLLVTLLVFPAPAAAQEVDAPEGASIASAEVSGLAIDALSPELRRDIQALAGSRLDRARLDALASRVEAEQPGVVAAARAVARPDGSARVIFVVARIAEDPGLASNINAQYTVEDVEISGVGDTAVSQPLRDELQSLTGRRLDPGEAERLEKRLADELPGRSVQRRIVRGSEPGRIRLIFDVRERDEIRGIPLSPSRSKVVYHSDHAWSGALDIPMGGHDHRLVVGLVFGDDERFVEEVSGIGVRVESRRAGTDRLGLSFEVAKHRQMWQPRTLSALASRPDITEPYRERLFVEPAVTIGFTPQLRLTAGISVSELESLSRSPESQIASAAVATLAYSGRWRPADGARHDLTADYGLRAGTDALESDLVYTRHAARADYRLGRSRNQLRATFSTGRVSGTPPLFERFALGDATTLRGWDKYDVAPAGGTRMFHQSTEYRFRSFALFVDAGAVWERGGDVDVKSSAGFGVHGDNTFLTLGFPLDAGEVRAAFMIGVRF